MNRWVEHPALLPMLWVHACRHIGTKSGNREHMNLIFSPSMMGIFGDPTDPTMQDPYSLSVSVNICLVGGDWNICYVSIYRK